MRSIICRIFGDTFDQRRRSDEEVRGVTDTIRSVTGGRAQTLEDFFRANAAEFGSVAAAT